MIYGDKKDFDIAQEAIRDAIREGYSESEALSIGFDAILRHQNKVVKKSNKKDRENK